MTEAQEDFEDTPKDVITRLLIVAGIVFAAMMTFTLFVDPILEERRREKRCQSILLCVGEKQRKKIINSVADEYCNGLKGQAISDPISPDPGLISSCTRDSGSTTLRKCKGGTTVTIIAEDEQGKKKPWKVKRRLGFVCDYEHEVGLIAFLRKRFKYFIEFNELSCELDKDYGSLSSPGIIEDKVVGGGKRAWHKKATDKAKSLIPTSSRVLPLPRKFQRRAPVRPKRSMPMRIPRKAC